MTLAHCSALEAAGKQSGQQPAKNIYCANQQLASRSLSHCGRASGAPAAHLASTCSFILLFN